jgi:hypothetical protein
MLRVVTCMHGMVRCTYLHHAQKDATFLRRVPFITAQKQATLWRNLIKQTNKHLSKNCREQVNILTHTVPATLTLNIADHDNNSSHNTGSMNTA